MNALITKTEKTVGPGPALSALLSEMDDLRDMGEESGGDIAKDLLGFLRVGALLETAPDVEGFQDEYRAAWQDVMRHDATTMAEVAMKCRATMLYRQGCKEWASDTFCDDDMQFLQQMISEGEDLYIEMLNNR